MNEPTPRITQLSEKLKALAHPYRLSIFEQLCQHSSNVTGIVEVMGIPQPSVSAHLAKLRTAGIIRGERHGQEINYSIADEGARLLLRTLSGTPA